MILFSKPFFACAGVAAAFLAVLCLARFLCVLCPNAPLFRYECLGICVPLLPTQFGVFLYPRVCRAGPGPIESNISVGFTSGHLPHSWTCIRACSRSPGSSTRLCAAIHLCEGRGCLARRGVGIARAASSDGWAASGVKLPARGRPRDPCGVFCHARLGGGRRVHLVDSQLEFFRRRKRGG